MKWVISCLIFQNIQTASDPEIASGTDSASKTHVDHSQVENQSRMIKAANLSLWSAAMLPNVNLLSPVVPGMELLTEVTGKSTTQETIQIGTRTRSITRRNRTKK